MKPIGKKTVRLFQCAWQHAHGKSVPEAAKYLHEQGICLPDFLAWAVVSQGFGRYKDLCVESGVLFFTGLESLEPHDDEMSGAEIQCLRAVRSMHIRVKARPTGLHCEAFIGSRCYSKSDKAFICFIKDFYDVCFKHAKSMKRRHNHALACLNFFV